MCTACMLEDTLVTMKQHVSCQTIAVPGKSTAAGSLRSAGGDGAKEGTAREEVWRAQRGAAGEQ